MSIEYASIYDGFLTPRPLASLGLRMLGGAPLCSQGAGRRRPPMWGLGELACSYRYRTRTSLLSGTVRVCGTSDFVLLASNTLTQRTEVRV